MAEHVSSFSSPHSKRQLKIALLRTSSLGDVILATSILHALKDFSFDVTFITRGPCLKLIAEAYPHVKVLEKPKSLLNTLKLLSEYDYFIDLQAHARTLPLKLGLLTTSRCVPITMKKRRLQRWLLILKARLRPRSNLALRIPSRFFQFQENLRTLERTLQIAQYTFDPQGMTPSVSLDTRPLLKQKSTGPTSPVLGLAVGASHPTKKPPTKLFIEVLKCLPKTTDVTFFGDKNDHLATRPILDFLKAYGWQGVLSDLTGKLEFASHSEPLQRVSVLLASDSSLAHFAEAVGTPTLVLFGPTHEAFGFQPSHPLSQALSAPLSCRPCSRHGKATCRFGDQKCFELIDPTVVAQKIVPFLTPESSQAHS